MKRPSPQKIVDEWNAKYLIGTPVTRYKLINPLREPQETKTRSAAWVMGGHSAMVMVEGVSGGVMVESVVAHSVPDDNDAGAPTGVSSKTSPAAATLSEPKPEEDSGITDAPTDRVKHVRQKTLHPNVVEALEAIRVVRETVAEAGMWFCARQLMRSRMTLLDHLTRVAPSVVEGVEEKEDLELSEAHSDSVKASPQIAVARESLQNALRYLNEILTIHWGWDGDCGAVRMADNAYSLVNSAVKILLSEHPNVVLPHPVSETENMIREFQTTLGEIMAGGPEGWEPRWWDAMAKFVQFSPSKSPVGSTATGVSDEEIARKAAETIASYMSFTPGAYVPQVEQIILTAIRKSKSLSEPKES